MKLEINLNPKSKLILSKKLRVINKVIRDYSLWVILIIGLTGFLFSGCRLSGGVEEITLLEGTETVTKSQGIEILEPDKTGGVMNTSSSSISRATFIICEIKGHIEKPGVYDLAEGSRVSDLIQRSGGLLDTGSLELVNQARKLNDGEVLIIPARGTTKEAYDAMAISNPGLVPVPTGTAPGGITPGESQVKLVNINTANEAELETIPGIGPVTAKNIIDYRTSAGPFAILEDLKKVDRIGDKTFEKLKAYITVGH